VAGGGGGGGDGGPMSVERHEGYEQSSRLVTVEQALEARRRRARADISRVLAA